ncbi:hypothetical protein EB796_015399 [Bugula neritina]|uniref:Uncharacterized protein n=1 Tax=Bugula neritina TaxID=10212 RepID=A0A7J7JL22_BUGNE|nr:hypothetical protein EB796_015399 [Bugula neritina]
MVYLYLYLHSILSLSNLQHLNISNKTVQDNQETSNQITCLPDNFHQLSSLIYLNLSGNDTLKALTPEIADMPLLISTSAVQQLLTLDEYKSSAKEFASKGIMHDKLFKHLLRTETDFQENPAMRVAAKILLSFRIMYQSTMQNEESSFIVPYFCKEFLSDSLPNTGSFLVDVTNFAIEYVETRWCACKIGCKFFCAHCGLEKDHHPSSLMNPFWVQHHDKRWMPFLHSFFDNQLKSQRLND